MQNWKKGCAGLLAAALTVGSIIPAGVLTANAQDETETGAAAQALEPKYAMDFEQNLDVEYGDLAEALEVKVVQSGSGGSELPSYAGEVKYTEGHNGGFAVDLIDGYGIMLDGVKADETYTVSFYTQISAVANFTPICSVSENVSSGRWYTLAGAEGNNQIQFWTSVRGNHTIGNSSFAAQIGQWTEYTIVQDGKSVKLYENGVLIRSEKDVEVDVTDSFRVMLGVNYWDPTPDCYIDDLKIYDEALTDAQVEALYKGEPVLEIKGADSVGVGRTVALNAETLNVENSTAVSWSTEDPDIASINANGVVTGVASGDTTVTATVMDGPTEVKGTMAIHVGKKIADFDFDDEASGFSGAGAVAVKNGDVQLTEGADGTNALTLNGTDAWLNVVGEDGESLLTGLDALTVSFDSTSLKNEKSWSFFAAPNAGEQLYSQENYVAAWDNDAFLNLEYYSGGRGSAVSASAASTYAAGWKHVDLVIDQNSITVYINKVKMAEEEIGITLSELLGEQSVVQIGKGNWTASGEFFSGQIDNYKIYSYAMTEDEIQNFVEVKEIAITGESVVEAGKTIQLNASCTPAEATNSKVIWSSDNGEVATVDAETGIVTGVKAGTANITASAADGSGVSDSVAIQVTPVSVTGVVIDGEAERTMEVGDKLTLAASVEPGNAEEQGIIWASDRDEVAKVDKDGNVIAMGEGTAVITATAVGNPDAAAQVVVQVKEKTYTVTVYGGSIVNPKESYSYKDMVTVKAEAENEGVPFSHWEDEEGNVVSYTTTYTFYVTRDIEYTAVYSEQVKEEVSVITSAEYDYSIDRFVFTVKRTVPESLCADSRIVEHGVLLTMDASAANDDDFILGGSGVKQAKGNSTGLLGTNILRVSSKTASTCYGRGYVVYRDALTKENVTVYGNIVACNR